MRTSTWKVKPGAGDVTAEEAGVLSLADGAGQPLHRQGVLGPNVHVALVGADGVAGYRHAFEHLLWAAFEHAAVHEGPRVALVGIAHDELAVRGAAALATVLHLRPVG